MKKISLLINSSLLILALAPISKVLAATEDVSQKHMVEFSSAQDNLSIDENRNLDTYFQEAAGGSPFDPRH